ncbi:MAG: FadR family transcriptional regulator [Acetobacteraceae bacterium]|nr:FadR family transcriptional regulator [Acetobacteraceae bacterium]
MTGHIRMNRLGPGDALPGESAFALQLGVSRAVAREAFRSMAMLRLIDVGNGRRPRVSAIDRSVLGIVLDHAIHTDQTSIQQIYDVRRTIELRTVSLAALRRSAEEAKRITALAAAMRADFAEAAQVMEHDIAFHEAVAVAPRNPLFAIPVGAFQVITRQTWPIGWNSRSSDAQRMASVAGHEAIARGIAAGDPRAAEAAMAEHFDASVMALLAAGVT